MSRRALRESERAHAQATLSRTDEVEPEERASDQQVWNQAPGPEPLHYTTQARPQMPHYDGQSFRARQNPSAQTAAETAPYRLRDFSPEARGTSFSSTQPAPSAPWAPSAAGSGDLDYHTSVGAVPPAPAVHAAPISAPPKLGAPAPVQAPAPAPAERADSQDGLNDRTLSRRELRALRNAAAPLLDDRPAVENVMPAPEPMVEPTAAPVVERTPLGMPLPPVAPKPDPSAEVEAAMAEFDALYLRGDRPAEMPDRPVEVAPQQPASAGIVKDDAPALDDIDLLHTLVEPKIAEPIAPTVMLPAPPVARPVGDAPIREVVTAPEVYSKPIGHWSTQAGIDDEHQIVDHTLSRDLAASDAITTSALVLPNFPHSGPFTGPVSSTGEILITGSIDLPRSLGVSGRYPSRYDSSDVDAIIDGTDREDAAPDSAPVRAIRAVSTHTSSQGIIATKRPKGSNLPVILSITAGVLAVSVVVLFVAGMIFKIF